MPTEQPPAARREASSASLAMTPLAAAAAKRAAEELAEISRLKRENAALRQEVALERSNTRRAGAARARGPGGVAPRVLLG